MGTVTLTPTVSVVIATRDRPADLARCLSGLYHVDRRLLVEVVIADDGSRRPVAAGLAATPLPVRVLRVERSIGADAIRNLAARDAEGDHLAFLDDDAVCRSDWLTVIADQLSSDVAVTGRVLRFDEGLVSRARQTRYDDRYRGLLPADRVRYFAGGNGAVRADAFHASGGFDPRAAGGDNTLAHRLTASGGSVRFRPDMVVAHRNSKGFCCAARAATLAGRATEAPPPAWTLLQSALRPASSGDPAVRALNTLLGLCHIAGQLLSRSERGVDDH